MGFEVKEEWKKVKLGEYCTVTSSKRFNISERSSSGIPFFCSKEIIQKVNGQEITECDYIKEEAYENIKRQFGVPKCGDLLITTRGTYGIPYIYKENDCFYFADGNLTWIKDFDNKLNVEYLYYWIKSYEGQKKIDAIAKGTAQKAVPILAIKNLELNLPPLPTQQKIAAILSAYDDLIENNRAQIKLLEEAAQKLYKEWFVKLNFPDHETTEIIDGIPAGWRKVKAEEYFKISIGKTPPRKEQKWFSETDGIKWVSIADMGNSGMYLLNTSEYLTQEAVKSHNIKKIPANTVLLSFKLTVGRVSITTEEMTTNEAIAHFVSDKDFIIEYLYLYLKNYNYNSLGSTSAISTAINSKIVKAMPLLIPDEDILKKFSEISKPYFDKIKNCQVAISNLRSARDKLLPKLMSGQVEV